jgi:integrase
MSRAYGFFGFKKRINILKKVKVDGSWKLCPAVVEPSGKLKDKVKVKGRTETHVEGVYYLEWRENGRRMRESVHNRSEVLKRARMKAFQLDPEGEDDPQRRLAPPVSRSHVLAAPATHLAPAGDLPANSAEPSAIAQLIFQAVESYIQQVARTALAMKTNLPTVDASGQQVPQGQAHASEPCPQIITVAPDSAKGTNAESQSKKILIAGAIESYLRDIEPPQREVKTYKSYRSTLHLFRDTCKKEYLEDITREDCLTFVRHLYSIGNGSRTAYNRIMVVIQFFKLHGITGLLKGRDKPQYVENIREIYQPEELEALFNACDADERVRYIFFLLTGERDREVRTTTWDDIDFVRQCVRVTEKKTLRFKPKDKEEREIPVPSRLLDTLKEYRSRQSGLNPHNLLFPTANGRPDTKFESKLKKIACRAGLNCGRCVGRRKHQCSSGPHCSKWFLHKFRHTFATASLENGASIRTLQEWLGHSDLQSTMAYLKYVRGKDIHRLVDGSQLAGFIIPSAPNSNAKCSPKRVGSEGRPNLLMPHADARF